MKRPKSIVDVGRGIGGSSRYLARKCEAQCGIGLFDPRGDAKDLRFVEGCQMVPRQPSKKLSLVVEDLDIPWSDLVLKKRIGSGIVFLQGVILKPSDWVHFQVLLVLSIVLIGMARYHENLYIIVDDAVEKIRR
ncbi:hypothetical protein LOK49_LG10G02222 [Camellia lanceoleosa]|uniref:Uncharacterized protein n=1 Tax=Camellia lanceoleosa TaxID=1840588 RepID=A0ACC0G773_9ERIC|nr:hypothetical protein LOK49_LG10G02222 [Camellia lanceoleosa]